MRRVIAAMGALLVLEFATPLEAEGTAPLTARIQAPRPLSYDELELGRATHDVRVTLTNPNAEAVPLSELALRFLPRRDGVEYACKETVSTSDRWPSELRPGGTVSAERSITCDTPLPGRYDIEVRAHATRAGEDAQDQVLGSFALQIDPGKMPPVALPWDKHLYAAAETTKEIRPGEKSGRLFVAVINGSNDDVTATPLRASLRVRQRGTKKVACPHTRSRSRFPRRFGRDGSNCSTSHSNASFPRKASTTSTSRSFVIARASSSARLRSAPSSSPSFRCRAPP
ncbi:hypothetical protein [Labilithrix luteola]|uniref:hypothetical protein n=1 Tax=Labilithrix luteola TaxID=1391654 RepID=UPI0011BA82F1|nr:hypothetical protein [Labilithrix luteola]